VDARASRRAEGRGDGVAYERVREREPSRPAGDLGEQSGFHGRLEDVEDVVAHDALDGHEIELGARHRGDRQHVARGLAQARDALRDELAHTGRHAAGLDLRPGELLDQERVAARSGRHLGRVAGGTRGVREPGGGVGPEALEPDVEDVGIAAQRRQQRGEGRGGPGLGAAQRRQDEQRGRVGGGGDVGAVRGVLSHECRGDAPSPLDVPAADADHLRQFRIAQVQ